MKKYGVSQAYNAGFLAGKTVAALAPVNPYPYQSADFEAWREGYTDGTRQKNAPEYLNKPNSLE